MNRTKKNYGLLGVKLWDESGKIYEGMDKPDKIKKKLKDFCKVKL
jgi:hypothetical protein